MTSLARQFSRHDSYTPDALGVDLGRQLILDTVRPVSGSSEGFAFVTRNNSVIETPRIASMSSNQTLLPNSTDGKAEQKRMCAVFGFRIETSEAKYSANCVVESLMCR